LDKLRRFFARRGVTLTAALIASSVAANAVQAAPAGLAQTISAVTLTKGVAASVSTLTLINGALKLMAWTKAKTAIIAGAVVILTVGTVTPVVIIRHHQSQNKNQSGIDSVFVSKTELSDDEMAKYKVLTGLTPLEMAQSFLEAFSNENWAQADKFLPPGIKVHTFPDAYKQLYGGLKIINIGRPYKGRISKARLIALNPHYASEVRGYPDEFDSPKVYVPYEIQLKNGTTKKFQLSISCNDPKHRWAFDGGL